MAVAAVVLALGQPMPGADLEREARVIDAMLIAPCCFSQQVSVHHSEAAAEVQRDVRARLVAGQTRQQILDVYVAQYGKRILAEPPAVGFDLMLYLTPIVIFVTTVGMAVVVMRRLTRRASGGIPALATGMPAAVIRPEDNARLDDELRDLD
jgi:cytochrome c-type biogenesis protein CcmH